MPSVTKRISSFRQPYGGYISPKDFQIEHLEDGAELFPKENISPALIGTTVDYLVRYMVSGNLQEAFALPLEGAKWANENAHADKLMSQISGLNDNSISNACEMAEYDCLSRTHSLNARAKYPICPDLQTINNIRIMVNRGVNILRKYGPVVKYGFMFPGGYTDMVSSGDGDYLTRDTIWEFKVSKNNLSCSQTLQLAMYFIMGCHSDRKTFRKISQLRLFNSRLNLVYTLNVCQIDKQIISKISKDVIGYGGHPLLKSAAENAFDPQLKYLSVSEYAQRQKASPNAVRKYCRSNRIEGVIRDGARLMIPENALYPVMRRKNS